MTWKSWALDTAGVFALTLVVSAAVTLAWSAVVHHAGAVDWETSFRLAILLGIIVPLAGRGRMWGRSKK